MVYLFFVAFFCVYYFTPLTVKLILVIIDAICPDPIPAVDEILMLIMIADHFHRIETIRSFMRSHKIWFIIICIICGFILYKTHAFVIGSL